MLAEKTLNEFTQELASSAPVPGGGAASALVGAIGIALGDMVGEFMIGKPKYAGAEFEAKSLIARAQDLRVRFLEACDKDEKAFLPLSKAYGIPKTDPKKEEIMEKCLKDAASAPLEMFSLCVEALELIRRFGEIGPVLVISDAATGAALVAGAMYGAAVNVKVNTKSMKDREYAERINKYVDDCLAKYGKMAEEIYTEIFKKY